MHERRFVLEPLCEIAPQAAHPLFRATIADLLLKLGSTGFQLVETGGMPALPAQRDLVGLRAVVTGSTSGIGRAIALELAGAGADIVVHGRRSEAADSLTAQIRSMNVRADSILADLSQPSGCRTLGQRAWEIRNGIDIWVNNAGADTLTGEAAHWPFEKKLKALWEVDVQTTILLSRDIGQRMKTRGSGVILNIGWDQAETGMEGDSGQMFSAVKAAIMAFTRSLALSLAPEVRVNCLAPGWIKTAWGDAASDRWQERVRRETPLKRWGTSEDVARAAHWLASPAASFITGQIIRVNGGAVR